MNWLLGCGVVVGVIVMAVVVVAILLGAFAISRAADDWDEEELL